MKKHKQEKSDNPFDSISFWLRLACIDFPFGFEETSEEENAKNETLAKIEKGGDK